MPNQKTIDVEVAYALPGLQKLISLRLSEGSSAYDAIETSKILEACPTIDLKINKVGGFGKAVKTPEKHILRDGDRIEIYRPLKIKA